MGRFRAAAARFSVSGILGDRLAYGVTESGKENRPRKLFPAPLAGNPSKDNRVREESVDAHAGRNREGQLRIDAHQKSHRKADQYRGRQHSSEGHAGLAIGRKDLGIDDHDVSHREESRDAGDGFGFKLGFLRIR